jgi:hypothetical protein
MAARTSAVCDGDQSEKRHEWHWLQPTSQEDLVIPQPRLENRESLSNSIDPPPPKM